MLLGPWLAGPSELNPEGLSHLHALPAVITLYREAGFAGSLRCRDHLLAASAGHMGMAALVVLRNGLPYKGIVIPLLGSVHQQSAS